MLLEAGLSKDFQVETMNIVCYMVNKSSLIVLKVKTLYEVQFGYSDDYYKLKVFSCLDYARIKEDKLGLRVKKCIFLGYTSKVKGYQLWCVDPKSFKFITNKDMRFDECAMFCKEKKPIDVNIDMN